MKIIITGATGSIGKIIAFQLINEGNEVIVFSRSVEKAKQSIPNAKEYIKWDYNGSDWYEKLSAADAVIHLAGENIMAKRWNKKHKETVISSRILSTTNLVQAIISLKDKPKVFITASAVGYYGNSELEVDESSLSGSGFLAEVANAWERASESLDAIGVRRVNVRIGIVLDRNEGALAKMIPAFKFFAGGPIGSGKQWFPWIHIDDVLGIFLFSLKNVSVKGAVNAVAPKVVRMNTFAKTIGKILHRPSFIKVPPFVLRILFGEGAKSVLSGAKVSSKKIKEAGYIFKYEELNMALESILNK